MRRPKKSVVIKKPTGVKKPKEPVVAVAEKPKEPVVAGAEKPKEQIIVINKPKEKKERKITSIKQLEKAIPKSLKNEKFQATDEQQIRIFKNYTQPQLLDNDTNDPNNDLVKSLKDVFGKDNKEKLNEKEKEPLPTFSYDNETVRQHETLKEKLANDLFAETDHKNKNESAKILQKLFKESTRKIKEQREKQKEIENEKHNELQKLVLATPYKTKNQLYIENNLEGIVGTAKKDKIEKEHEKEHNSAKIITRAMSKQKNKKINLQIQDDLEAAKMFNQFNEKQDGFYVKSAMRGNKVVGLDYEISEKKAEKMKPRNLLADFQKVKPKKEYREYKSTSVKIGKNKKDTSNKKDASTGARGVGRPALSSYRTANPSNFKSGQ